MKFRNPKTGEVFEGIIGACRAHCVDRECNRCALYDCDYGVKSKGSDCTIWCDSNPAEAARLMGYEVVEEERYVDSHIGTEKFESICEAVHNGWWDEKKKQGVDNHPDMIPYSELSEPVKEYDRVTVRRVLDALGVSYEKKLRFTPEEVERAKAVLKLYGDSTICREETGLLYCRNAPCNYHIPTNLFPSIKQGESFKVSEVIGDE